MNATAQIEYESRVRVRYGVLAFAAALLLVGAQLIGLVGPSSSIDETTLGLIVANKRAGLDLGEAFTYFFGMFALLLLLTWLFRISRARNPGMKQWTLWLSAGGTALGGVMYLAYIIVLTTKAHTFVTTGNQGYPEAYALTNTGLVRVLPLLWQLGALLLAVGSIWTSLNAMRVGLITRMVGYIGVICGAMFIFQLPVLTPIVQGYWLAAVAITLAGRWPSGDPPAWAAGEAVAWPSGASVPGPREQRSRSTRAQRRRVSTQEVLAAVEPRNENGVAGTNSTPSPSTSASKRKRKRK
jgi:hypothetical protein